MVYGGSPELIRSNDRVRKVVFSFGLAKIMGMVLRGMSGGGDSTDHRLLTSLIVWFRVVWMTSVERLTFSSLSF